VSAVLKANWLLFIVVRRIDRNGDLLKMVVLPKQRREYKR
jgi:hypothetical protein